MPWIGALFDAKGAVKRDVPEGASNKTTQSTLESNFDLVVKREGKIKAIRMEFGDLIDEWENENKDLSSTQIKERLPSRIQKLANIIRKYGIGNCNEQAIVGLNHIFEYLDTHGLDSNHIPLDIVVLQNRGDHYFVAINQPLDEKGEYPKDFRKWNSDAFIFDPWGGNIICRAQDFPTVWEHRIRDMQKRNILIDGRPIDDSYLNAVQDHPKGSALSMWACAPRPIINDSFDDEDAESVDMSTESAEISRDTSSPNEPFNHEATNGVNEFRDDKIG